MSEKTTFVGYFGIHKVETREEKGDFNGNENTIWNNDHRRVIVNGVTTPICFGLWGCEWGQAYSDGKEYWKKKCFFSLPDFLRQRGWLPPGYRFWLWPRRYHVVTKYFGFAKKWWHIWD
jgi:hypothetical protein